jgi:hypothetical protein
VSGSYALPHDGRASGYLAIEQARQAYSATVSFERSLAEVLPNQRIAVNGQVRPSTRGVAIGRVVDVQPGVAYTVAGDDADAGTETEFDDPDAVWRIAVVTVKADHLLVRDGEGASDEPATVRFGAFISAGHDAAAQMAGIKELGDVIVVLDPTRAYKFDRGLPWIARSGSLFGDIDAQGRIGFPALAEENEAFVGTLTTVERVLAQAAEKPNILAVTIDAASGKISWPKALTR